MSGLTLMVAAAADGRLPGRVEPVKLLLTEVCTLGSDQEFIEIWNPGTQDVDLGDYYLTDATYTPANTGYWNLGAGVPTAETVGGGAFTDFLARFPAGYTLAAGDTITVSVPGSARFTAAFGFAPDFELFEDDATPDAVPNLRSIFPAPGNSIVNLGSQPALTNVGELVILFHWREGDALVTDVDVFVYGASGSHQFSKTGRTVAGVGYAPETSVAGQHPYSTAAPFGQSYARIDALEGGQVPTGSNGVGGRDELSERWDLTWALQAYSPVRPGPRTAAVGDDAVARATDGPLRCHPNPFNPCTTVSFTVPAAGPVRLAVYDAAGRRLRTLVTTTLAEGRHDVVWDGRDDAGRAVPSGAYLCRLDAGGARWARRVALVK